MATTRVIGRAASPEPIKLLQDVVSSVLDDEGFNLPTEECKRSQDFLLNYAAKHHPAVVATQNGWLIS